MEAIELKQSLLSTIDNIDERNTDLQQKLVAAVKSIIRQNAKERTDEITPFVQSMKVGVKLPADLDVKALRDEHLKEKYS